MDDLLDIFELQDLPNDEKELKRQYFKLCKKWHPDKNPNNVDESTERFKKISDAFEKLKNMINGCNVKKRKFKETESKHFFDSHVDISKNCTYNLNAHVNVTLEQIFTGVTITVKIKRQEVCNKCCKGNYYKFYTCSVCHSERVYYKEVDFEVNVPQSCQNGYKIVLPKESHRSLSAEPGDLNIFVTIIRHPIFSVQGKYHLKMKYVLSVHQVITKKKFTIKSIDNSKYRIKKPKYQTFMPNTCVKIKNAGLFDPERAKRAHLYVYFDIKDFDKMRKDQKIGWFEASECLRKKSKTEEYIVKKNIKIIHVNK